MGGPGSVVIIDTCVLMDMFIVSRSRHRQAEELRALLKQLDVTPRIPMHGIFELRSAMQQELRATAGGRAPLNRNITEADALPMQQVPIDEVFIKKYLAVNLPDLRAGDLIFVALAKGDGLDLVTEDVQMYQRSTAAGVPTFKIAEYMNHLRSKGSQGVA
jgi:predicted nucleic acid-binding protein